MKKPFTGLRAWLVQRLSALYMLSFIVFFLIHFAVDAPHSYEAWRSWMTGSGVRSAAAVFFAALLAHAWVGLRDVILDYIHPVAFRFGSFVFVGVGLTATGIWVVRILSTEHGFAV